MQRAMLTPELIEVLRTVDTPTVCNALELAAGGRSAEGFTYGTVIAAPRPMKPVLGYARTARIRAMAPAARPMTEVQTLRLGYYRHVATTPALPTIVVMQDLDDRPGTGAFWGEVNSAVHRGLNVAGVITNGSVRDLDDLSPDVPILAGSIGPSHAFVHLIDIGTPVEVFGLRVAHDDLLHADRHGAVRIPPQFLNDLPRCMNKCGAERPRCFQPRAGQTSAWPR